MPRPASCSHPAAGHRLGRQFFGTTCPYPIQSIGCSKLRAIQHWALYSFAHHLRAALIADKHPKVSAKPLAFSATAPPTPLGSWTLIAPDRMLAASLLKSFPNGEVRFVGIVRPSRAYLKLWELVTLLGQRPKPSSASSITAPVRRLDSLLQRLGARVISVDWAP
jgi:23S rRNA (cytidine2498-2'-O)-methyltransferase